MAGAVRSERSRERLYAAYQAYWAAGTHREMVAAYYEILLSSGKDGYGEPGWRASIARWLRRLAVWVEG